MGVEDQKVIFFVVRSTIVNGGMKTGIFRELANQLGFERRAVARQWRNMETSLRDLLHNQTEELHAGIIEESHHILFKVNHSARRLGKYKHNRAELQQRIKDIPFKERKTRRLLAARLNLPLSTTQCLVRDRRKGPKVWYGGAMIKVYSSSIKLALTDGNKLHRFLYCRAKIREATIHMRNPGWQDYTEAKRQTTLRQNGKARIDPLVQWNSRIAPWTRRSTER